MQCMGHSTKQNSRRVFINSKNILYAWGDDKLFEKQRDRSWSQSECDNIWYLHEFNAAQQHIVSSGALCAALYSINKSVMKSNSWEAFLKFWMCDRPRDRLSKRWITNLKCKWSWTLCKQKDRHNSIYIQSYPKYLLFVVGFYNPESVGCLRQPPGPLPFFMCFSRLVRSRCRGGAWGGCNNTPRPSRHAANFIYLPASSK